MVHSRKGRLPVRLVMMNSAKQVRIRCRVIRHHTVATRRRRTCGMAVGTPVMEATTARRMGRVVWSARSTQPVTRPNVRPISGVHHHRARRTGQAMMGAARLE